MSSLAAKRAAKSTKKNKPGRKAGRPPGSKKTLKRGPGRPAKSVASIPTPTTKSKSGRKPGRPPGSASLKTPVRKASKALLKVAKSLAAAQELLAKVLIPKAK